MWFCRQGIGRLGEEVVGVLRESGGIRNIRVWSQKLDGFDEDDMAVFGLSGGVSQQLTTQTRYVHTSIALNSFPFHSFCHSLALLA